MPKPPRAKPLPRTPRQTPYPLNTPGTTSIAMAGPCPTAGNRRTATPWNETDDHKLIEARQKGLTWQAIAPEHFPDKTANACRKRHERLMAHNANNWDSEKFESLAKAYWEMRPKIWVMLADRLGEKWEDVERKCIEKGLKTLKNVGQTVTRREQNDHSSLGLETDTSRPSSEIGRDELQPPYLRAQEYQRGSYHSTVSDEEHHPFQNRREDRTVSYQPGSSYRGPRVSPTSSATSVKHSSRTSPSHQHQQLPGLGSFGISNKLSNKLPNGLPGVEQLLRSSMPSP